MKAISLVVLALLPNTTMANTIDQKCRLLGTHASLIMGLRQHGKPMSDAMEGASEDIKPIVIAAYEHPRFNTDEMIEKARQDFQNDVELACYKSSQ